MAQIKEATIVEASGAAKRNADLARTKWSRFMKESEIEDSKQPMMARLLENQISWMQNLDEETRVASIGSFERFIFPMVRAVYPNLVAADLVSVQPMEAPTSLIFYRETRFGSSKGAVSAGDSMFSARTGWNDAAGFNYTSETVENEGLGIGAGAGFNLAGSPLAYKPIRPGTVVITFNSGANTITDDGAGGLTGDLVAPGTINYTTGALTGTTSPSATASVPILATYEFNSEGNLEIPQVDLILTSTPVVARPRKLRARWSIEAAAQLKAVHGDEAEVELMTDMANEIRIEIDREIIQDLIDLADANNTSGVIPVTQFDKTPPAGVSLYLHRQSFVYKIIEASNKIFRATRRHGATWIICGSEIANIIQGQEGEQFVPAGSEYQGSGVQFIGTLKGQWKVYLDPYMNPDHAVLGYKGMSFLDAGYVYAPWIPFYATPTIYLDDFLGRKGLLTMYAKKPVNGFYFAKLETFAT